MDIFSFSSSVQRAYEFADYVPFVSTAKSLYNLFERYVWMDTRLMQMSPQHTGFERGSVKRDLVLLLPFLGNFSIMLHDFFYPADSIRTRAQTMISESTQCGESLGRTSWNSIIETETALAEELGSDHPCPKTKSCFQRLLCFCGKKDQKKPEKSKKLSRV